MSSRLRHLVDEYHERLDRHQQLARKAKLVVLQWNASLGLKQPLKLQAIKTTPKKRAFVTERSTQPVTRVSLSELSKELTTPAKQSIVGEASPAGVSRFLSLKSIGRSKELVPKMRTQQRQKTRSVELPSISSSPVARPSPHLKFKLLSKSFHSVEDLFPVNKFERSTRSVNRNAPALSYNPTTEELQALVRYYFQRKCRVLCVFKKHQVSLRAHFCYFRLPFDMSEPKMRKQWKHFLKRLETQFGLNSQKTCFVFDLEGNPITSLLGLCRQSSAVLLSNQPKLEFVPSDPMKLFFEQKNALLKALYQSIGIDLHQYLTDNHMRMKERGDYIEEYCQKPAEADYSNAHLIRQYEAIDSIYSRKNQEAEEQATPQKRLSIFMRVSPKKKDFVGPELELVQSRRNMLLGRNLQSLRKRAASEQKLPGRNFYQLNHRDLMKKMAMEPDRRDFMIKTKFNREEMLRLKSLYDSILAIAVKSDPTAAARGVRRELMIQALGGFGLDTSPNLLLKLLEWQPFVRWEHFLRLMESLIHKNSSESLDEYLQTLGATSGDNLTFQQIVKIIHYGLEKLVIFKDSFYDGYEILFSRQLFKEMGLQPDQPMPVRALRSYLQQPYRRKTFEYIFFE